MQAMEACSYEECGAVNSVCNCEGGFIVFYGLEEGEIEAEGDRDS